MASGNGVPNEKTGLISSEGLYEKSSNYNATGIEDDNKTEESCIKRTYKTLFPLGYVKEFKATLNLSWAITWQKLASFILQPIAVMFAGRLGRLELDAVSLSNSLINVGCYSILVGMASGIDTVFSQVYGSKNKQQLGIQLQKALIILFVALMPCIAVFLNIQNILNIFGQDPRVASMCQRYLLIFLPGIFFMYIYAILNTYMRCQGVVRPQIIITTFGALLHALLQYICVYVLDMGFDGSALAIMLAYFSLAGLTLLYVIITKLHKKTWTGFSIQCLAEWKDMTILSISGLLMTALEWWMFEITIILSGMIGTVELGAQSITFNLYIMMWTIGGGFGVATSIRVGQSLGAGNHIKAISAARVGYSVTIFTALLTSIVFASLRTELPKIFTNDQEVINLVSQLLPIIAIYSFFDAISGMGRAITRGIGKQIVGTILTFVGHWLFCLPIGISLLFLTPLKTMGLWIGLAISLFINSIQFFVYTNFICDFQKLSNEAIKRAGLRESNTYDNNVTEIEVNDNSTEKTPILGRESEPSTEVKTEEVYFPVVTKRTVIKRILTISAFVSIAVVGIICRIFVPTMALPYDNCVGYNETNSDNTTNCIILPDSNLTTDYWYNSYSNFGIVI